MKCLKFVLQFAIIFVSSCTSNYYENFYSSYEQPIEKCDVLKKTSPQIVEIEDLSTISEWEAKGYCVLGKSEFEGKWQSRAWAIDHAKKIGASHILTYFQNTYMKLQNTSMSIPVANTTYHTGNIYTPNHNISYSGTSTSYQPANFAVPEIYATWKQTAIFLTPIKNIPAFGVEFDEASRIPGATDSPVKIRLVYNNSIAEKNGIKIGDEVISINGTRIRNHKELKNFLPNKEIKMIEVLHEK